MNDQTIRVDDLIRRANKYAKNAGKTQEGQRRSAVSIERISRWLSWTTTVLGAVVGTSIFAGLVKENGLPYVGVAAVVAAAFSAIQGNSKLEERAEAHRLAAATYGGLRRRADMLKLRLKGEFATPEEGLAELEQITKELTELAKKPTTPTVTDRLYKKAKKVFKEGHQYYYTIAPTHAGGVVFRKEGDAIQYLIVQAKKKKHEWVLPKGHIKDDESSEQAARREVLEETGIEAAIWDSLDTVEFKTPSGEKVKSHFYLMEAIGEGQASEERVSKWLSFDDAMQELQYKESQWLVFQANSLMQKTNKETER